MRLDRVEWRYFTGFEIDMKECTIDHLPFDPALQRRLQFGLELGRVIGKGRAAGQ